MAKVKRRTGGQWRVLSGAARTESPPDAPAIFGVSAGDGTIGVTWTAPRDTGGSPITGYTVTRSPGGTTVSVGGGTLTAQIAGTNGVPYTVTVTATNAHGSTVSPPSATVTPVSSGPPARRTALNTGIAGVALTLEDLDVYDCAVLGNVLTGSLYEGVRFINIPPGSEANGGLGGLRLSGADKTFSQCAMIGPDNWPNPKVGSGYFISAHNTAGKSNHAFTDCLINGGGVQSSTYYPSSHTPPPSKPFPASGNGPYIGIAPGVAVQLTRCHLQRFGHFLQPQDTPAGESYLVDMCFFDDALITQGSTDVVHQDGLQIAGTGMHDLEIRYSTFDFYRPAAAEFWLRYVNTSSLCQFGSFPKNADGTLKAVLRDIDLHDNYINGGQKGANLGVSSALVCENVHLRRNRFGVVHNTAIQRGTTPAGDGGLPAVTDNVWDAAGTTLAGLVVVEGQLIA